MPVGYKVGDRCFATIVEATDYTYSMHRIEHYNSTGSNAVLYHKDITSGLWLGKPYSLVTNPPSLVGSTYYLPPITFAGCDMTDGVFDGLALGWLVAGVWIAAWAVAVLRKSTA